MIPTQSPISGPLAALMQLKQAEQALKQGANPVTPSGQPTVAGQAIQSAQALTQPQQPQPQMGIANLRPGIQQQAMRQAQAQQPVTQAQLAQAVQQAQQPSQGIAAGPQDIGMAEGGIVGYNGQEDSYVDTALLRKTPEAYERARQAAMLRGAVEPRRPASKRTPEEELIFSFLDRPPVTEIPIPDIQIAGQERGKEMRYPPRFPDSVTESKKKTTSSSASSASSVAVPSGIAQLVRDSEADKIYRASLAAAGRIQGAEAQTPEQFDIARRAEFARRGIDPDFYKTRLQQIEALKGRDAAEAAERAKMVEGRGMENLIGFLTRTGGAKSLARGLGQASRGMEGIVAQQRKEDQAFSQLMRDRQEATNKELAAVQNYREALATGDIAKAEQSKKEALAARNEKAKTEAEIHSKYAPQRLQAETADLDRASRERMEALQRSTQLEAARIGAAARTDQQTPEIRLLEWLRDPANARLYEKYMGAKAAPKTRADLLKEWGSDIMLRQTFPNFEDYAMLAKASVTGGPPPGAVREKGKQ